MIGSVWQCSAVFGGGSNKREKAKKTLEAARVRWVIGGDWQFGIDIDTVQLGTEEKKGQFHV